MSIPLGAGGRAAQRRASAIPLHSGEESCDPTWHIRLISQIQPCSKKGPISPRDAITPQTIAPQPAQPTYMGSPSKCGGPAAGPGLDTVSCQALGVARVLFWKQRVKHFQSLFYKNKPVLTWYSVAPNLPLRHAPVPLPGAPAVARSCQPLAWRLLVPHAPVNVAKQAPGKGVGALL